jgi:hypothetical protein
MPHSDQAAESVGMEAANLAAVSQLDLLIGTVAVHAKDFIRIWFRRR